MPTSRAQSTRTIAFRKAHFCSLGRRPGFRHHSTASESALRTVISSCASRSSHHAAGAFHHPFTISNVGSHAGRFATPIINYPEVAILAVGRGREGMVVRDGWFRVGKLLPLSLACDHRVVDGATAALLLARIIELLEAPDQLLEPARGG
ncbi:MAG: 2-oxo acid dehydrogenase subunit E2 [Phycisphaerales bacterium JB039]